MMISLPGRPGDPTQAWRKCRRIGWTRLIPPADLAAACKGISIIRPAMTTPAELAFRTIANVV